MHRAALRITVVAAALVAQLAWATHPIPPVSLAQEEPLGTNLATGGIAPPGDVYFLGSSSGSSYGTGYYRLEFEIIDAAQSFTGTPTHTSDCLGGPSYLSCSTAYNKPSSSVVAYPPTKVTLNNPGNYKWRVREHKTFTSGTVQTSTWVNFNGGLTAFTIAPPNVPDILVTNVALSNVVATASDLSFTVVGDFKNRGAVATGNFGWNAYLSTDKTLSSADTLIYSSPTNAVDVPGSTTLSNSSTQITISPRPTGGSYYVLIEADPGAAGCTTACGQVTEFDELNNNGSMPNYFVNGIDLVATSISNGPLQAGPGVPITLTVSFFNQGVDAPANAVDFRIFSTRSQSGTFPYEVYSNSVTVGGGQVLTLPITFTLPAGAAGGDVWWGLQVDQTNGVTELFENNNMVLTANQTHVQQAELMAAGVDLVDMKTLVSIRKADIGFPARFRVNVQNIGDWASFPVKMGMIISRDNTLSLLGDDMFAPELDMGAVNWVSPNNSATFDAVVTIPTEDKKGVLTTGDYFFFVYVDSLNDINELNESNNTTIVQGPVRLRLPTPDYAITRVVSVAQAAGGEAVALTRTIKNIGTQDGALVDYRCFASPNAIITTQDFPLKFVEPNGSTVSSRSIQLAMGVEDSATETVRLPGTIPAGSYYFGCIVDAANALPELEELNNARATALQVAVAKQAFSIVTQQLPDGIIGMPYSFRLTSVGAPSTVSWSIDATTQAPEGLSLSTDGLLSGTPAATGIQTFKVVAVSGNFETEQVLVGRVLPPTTQLTITSDNLPPVVNSPSIPYQGTFSASGGAQPYTWSLVSGNLPSGISLQSATGLVSGTPRTGLANGEVKLGVMVRDSLGASAQKELRLRILAPGALSIATLALPDALVNSDYFGDLAANVANGGMVAKPVAWQVVGGKLPEGLALTTHPGDQITGLISGKPTVAGTYPVTIQASDNEGRADVVDFLVRIYPANIKVFMAEALPAEVMPGDTVDFTVTSNGTSTRFRLFSGMLPPGLALAQDGKLGGTVAEEDAVYGVYNFVVEGVDANGGTGLGAFSLEVVPRPVDTGCGAAGGLPNALLALLALGGLALRRRRPRS